MFVIGCDSLSSLYFIFHSFKKSLSMLLIEYFIYSIQVYSHFSGSCHMPEGSKKSKNTSHQNQICLKLYLDNTVGHYENLAKMS